MKTFFAAEQSADAPIDIYSESSPGPMVGTLRAAEPTTPPFVDAAPQEYRARVAVYDSPLAAPRVQDVRTTSPRDLIDALSETVYELAHQAGGAAPYTVLREVVENLIHADFQEIVVSILESGRVVRFADQGPGIADKNQAVRPGFTTATTSMKDYIRGVGSGLPIVSEFLAREGGTLVIEDNLGRGTVVTLSLEPTPDTAEFSGASPATPPAEDLTADVPPLSLRQKKVLSLVMELGEVGPTLVSKELAVGLSTAYRDLASLEEFGLIEGDDSGKRVLTTKGSVYLGRLFD